MTNYFKKIYSSLLSINIKCSSKFTKGAKYPVKFSVNMKEIIKPIGISTTYSKVIGIINVYNILDTSIYKNLFK